MEVEPKQDIQLQGSDIRRSSRTKTPSMVYAEMFEDPATTSKKSVTKQPGNVSGKKSFQKRNKPDENEFTGALRSHYDLEVTGPKHEQGEIVTEWLPFLTGKGNTQVEKKVCFVINSPGSDDGEPTNNGKGLLDSLTVPDDRLSDNMLLAQNLPAPSLSSNVSTHSNNNSEKDFATKKNGNNRTRAVRKPKHLNDDFLFGSDKTSFRAGGGKTSKQKRDVKKPAPVKTNPTEFKDNFLDMILSAAINAQSASKGVPMESPGAITNGKLSVNRTSSGGAAKRGEKTNENRRSSYPGKNVRDGEEDELSDSTSIVVREKRENYIKNVEIQVDKIILHHSKLDPCVAKFIKPKMTGVSQEELLSSKIWTIGKESDEENVSEDKSPHEKPVESLYFEEQRLKSYFQQQMKKYKPSILT